MTGILIGLGGVVCFFIVGLAFENDNIDAVFFAVGAGLWMLMLGKTIVENELRKRK